MSYDIKKYWFYDLAKATGFWPWFLYYRPKWVYVSKKAKKRIRGGALIVMNHNSSHDTIYMQMAVPYRRHRILAAKEMYSTPKVRWILEHLLSIEIDRDHFSPASFRQILRELKKGNLVDIFPEGKLHLDKTTIGELKDGAAMISFLADVPIIPIIIVHSDNKWKRLKFIIGEPITAADAGCDGKEAIGQYTELIKKRMEEALAFQNSKQDDRK